MCLRLYLGSNVDLTHRANENISVERLAPDLRNALPDFSESNVYLIGSHTGCSCGFPSVNAESHIDFYEGMFDDSAEREENLASVRELLLVLDECLAAGENCTLIPIWNGDEMRPLKGEVRWHRSQMAAETFVITEQFRYTVIAEPCDAP